MSVCLGRLAQAREMSSSSLGNSWNCQFVGRSTGEVGVITLIKDHLCAKFKALKVDQKRHCSLNIDDMAIQHKVVYDHQVHKIFGLVDMGIDSLEASSSGMPQVANRLLFFVIHGLSTAYIILVGHFFTRCLSNDELKKMTLCHAGH